MTLQKIRTNEYIFYVNIDKVAVIVEVEITIGRIGWRMMTSEGFCLAWGPGPSEKIVRLLEDKRQIRLNTEIVCQEGASNDPKTR